MDDTGGSGADRAGKVPDEGSGTQWRPSGLLDLRGHSAPPGAACLHYPAGAVVVVSGLPGSGKSTLLRRWSRAVPAVDPRDVHLACEAVMPRWLPYAVYRPWARLVHLWRLRVALRGGGPLLVHDCGSRPWMRRWLARGAGRQGRELHLVLLDVGMTEALAGQQARGRWASQRVFARHLRGLDRLLRALSPDGALGPAAVPAVVPGAAGASVPSPARVSPLPGLVAGAASVVLLDTQSREDLAAEFGPERPLPTHESDGVPVTPAA